MNKEWNPFKYDATETGGHFYPGRKPEDLKPIGDSVKTLERNVAEINQAIRELERIIDSMNGRLERLGKIDNVTSKEVAFVRKQLKEARRGLTEFEGLRTRAQDMLEWYQISEKRKMDTLINSAKRGNNKN